MLFNKPYSDGDVITLKLTSGEEILASFNEETETYFVLRKPMVLVNSGQGAGIVPYILSSDEDANLRLMKNSVVVHTPTQSEMAKEYLSKTSGIQMNF